MLTDTKSFFPPLQQVAETCEVGLGRVTWLQKSQKSLDPAAVRAKEKFPKTTDPSPAFDAPSPPVAELRRILQSPRESLFDRYQALFSLRNAAIVSLTNEVVDALSESVTAPGSALLRHEAAFLLGQLNITGTTDALIGRLSDASEAPMVRHESAISLGKVAATAGASGGEQDSLAKRARQALLEGSKDSEPVVRDSCVLALVMSDYSSSNEQFEIAETPSA